MHLPIQFCRLPVLRSHIVFTLSICLLNFAFTEQAAYAQQRAADLVLVNGNVFTVDESRPTAEAVAMFKGRIVAVGTNESVEPWIGDETKVVDLDGKFVMPGFIEGHGHFVGLGESKMMLNLQKAKTWNDIVVQVAEAAKTTPRANGLLDGDGTSQNGKTTDPKCRRLSNRQ